MRAHSPRLRRSPARRRVVDPLVGVGAGVVGALTLAASLLAFGTSASATLEDAYEPLSSAVD